jgi:hypothetical protein
MVFEGPLTPLRQEVRIYGLDAQGVPSIDDSFTLAFASIGAGFEGCRNLHLIDVDGNGSKELMFARCRLPESASSSQVAVYARAADGTYAEWTRQSFGQSSSFLIADMDRDGREDVMATLQSFFAGSFVRGGFSRPEGGFEMSPLHPFEAVGTIFQYESVVADMNGDGLPDLIFDDPAHGLTIIYLRN